MRPPGWGDDAFTDVDGNTWPFNNAFDYYVKAIANVAYAEGDPVADIDPEEAHMQGLDELNELFQKAVTAEEWPRSSTSCPVAAVSGPRKSVRCAAGRAAKPMAKSCMTYIYNEKRATVKNDYSGETYRAAFRTTRSTTPTCRWSPITTPSRSIRSPRPSTSPASARSRVWRKARSCAICARYNYIEINDEDATALGIKDGDQVRVLTPAGDVTEGEAMVRAGQVRARSPLRSATATRTTARRTSRSTASSPRATPRSRRAAA